MTRIDSGAGAQAAAGWAGLPAGPGATAGSTGSARPTGSAGPVATASVGPTGPATTVPAGSAGPAATAPVGPVGSAAVRSALSGSAGSAPSPSGPAPARATGQTLPGPAAAAPASAGPAAAPAPAGPVPAPAALLPALARLGGLPSSAVPAPEDALIEALDRLRRLDEKMAQAGDRLLDPLYRLIPNLERDARRAVLHTKRRVFQGRLSGLEPRVRGSLPADVGAMLSAWDDLVARRCAQYARLEAAVAADLDRSRAVLAAGLDDAGYLRSVAIAAPALVAALTRRGRRLDDSRVLRTLYSLATRTALKASPFAGLTTVCEAGRPARGRRRCTVALHLAYGILAATAHDLDPDGLLRLEAAPVRDVVGPDGEDGAPALAVVAEHDYADGMVFRPEEVQPARWLAVAHDRLTGGRPDAAPVSVSEAAGLVGGRAPLLRLRRLLASGAVRPHVPWPRGENPFPALTATLSDAQRRTWGEDLEGLQRLGRAIAVEDGPGRAELLTDVQRLAQRIFPDGELGRRPGGLLYEDCESRGQWADPMEVAGLRHDVEALAGLVDPWVTRSHIYDLMVRRYVARYGRGGVCEDPLAFVMDLAHAPDGDPEMLGAAARDMTAGPDPERAAMPGGVSASPRHMGAYIQPVGGPEVLGASGASGAPGAPGASGAPGAGVASGAPGAGVASGLPGASRGLVVVNAFTNGNGSLQARFHRLLGRGYRARLAQGIRAAWGVERVLEIQASTDCNTAQAASCGVLPPLGLPGEPAAPDAVALSSLRLAHDPRTDTLFLADARGPVGLAYLGLIPQYRLGGYLSWLVLLSDPWARMAPLADHWNSRRLEMTGPLPDEVVHAPRVVHGRLVTRRESWTFPAAQVTGLLDRDLAATLLRVADLREQWGIPAEVYVHQHLGVRVEPGATADEHKPRYVDLRSPVSLLALRGWIDPAAEHLSLVEALPARRELAGATPAGEPTVLEYLVGVQWPKSEGGAR